MHAARAALPGALVAFALAFVVAAPPHEASAREIRILGPDGRPAPGAVAWLTSPGALDRIAADPHSGLVTLPDAGIEAACATAPGLQPSALSAPTEAELALKAGMPLAGSLRSAGSDDAVAGAIVRLQGDEPLGPCARQAAPDARGQWLLTGLPPGRITIDIVTAPGHVVSPAQAAIAGPGRRLDLALHRACAVTLTVSDADGKPLPSAAIRILPEWRRRPLEPPAWTELRRLLDEWTGTTAADGTVRLPPLPWRSGWRIAADHPGFAPASVTVAADAPSKAASVTLRPGASITVRALDDAGSPLSGAIARVVPVEGEDLELAPEPSVSGSDGIVRLARVPPGRLALEVRAPGRVAAAVRGLESRAGAVLDGGDVVLEPGLTLAGRVTSGSEPLRGATIVVRGDGAAGAFRRETSSGDAGAFAIDGLPAEAPLRLDVSAEAHAPAHRELPARTTDAVIDLTPARDVLVELRDASTHEPLSGGGARLTATDGWPRIEAAELADDLRLRLDAVPHGTHDLLAWSPGHATTIRRDVAIDGGGPELLTVELSAARQLAGIVLDVQSRQPLEGARVTGPHPEPVVTGPDGSFVLDGVTGPFPLRVGHATHVESSMNVAPDELPAEGLVVALEAGGSVEGIVVDGDGRPIAGAEVSGGSSRGLTDAGGRYRLDGLKPGIETIVKTNRPGSLEGRESKPAEIAAGRVSRCDFGSGARVHGRVTREGEPLAGATLSLMTVPANGGTPGFAPPDAAARSDAEGRYELSGIAPGLHVLQVAWGALKSARDVTVSEGSRDVALDLELGDVRITGTVMDAVTREPMAGVDVRAVPPGGDGRMQMSSMSQVSDSEGNSWTLETTTRPGAAANTSADGTFALSVLQRGRLSLTAWKDGYERFGVDLDGGREGMLIELQPKQARQAQRLVVRLLDDATGEQVPGSLATWGGSGSGFTEGSGRITLSLEPESLPLTMFAWARGYAILQAQIDAEAAVQGDVTRDLRLSAGGSLRLLVPPGVLDGSLTCGEDMKLSVTTASGFDIMKDHLNFCLNVGSRLATPSADGSWTIADLPAGPITVAVAGLPPRTIEIVPREVVELDLR